MPGGAQGLALESVSPGAGSGASELCTQATTSMPVALAGSFPASLLEALGGATAGQGHLFLPPQHQLSTLCSTEPCQSWGRHEGTLG